VPERITPRTEVFYPFKREVHINKQKKIMFLSVNKYHKDQPVKDASGNNHFNSENPEYQIALPIRRNADF